MSNEPMSNNDEFASFSGELEFEDLEFLCDRQAEKLAGGLGFSLNNGFPDGPFPKKKFKKKLFKLFRRLHGND